MFKRDISNIYNNYHSYSYLISISHSASLSTVFYDTLKYITVQCNVLQEKKKMHYVITDT